MSKYHALAFSDMGVKDFVFRKFTWGVFLKSLLFFVIGGLSVYVFSLYIAEIFLSDQLVTVIAQESYSANSPASLRVIIQNEKNDGFVSDASIVVRLKDDRKSYGELFRGSTSDGGSVNISFRLPELVESEKYFFEVDVSSELGHDTVKKYFHVQEGHRTIVTLDRSLYKPGQIFRWRALYLRSVDFFPIPGEMVTARIFDAENNQIFQGSFETSEYGIISDDFPLASELNTGEFRLELSTQQAKVKKRFSVKPFTLPKFSVIVQTDKPYYRYGQVVRGIVHAKYFFGESVLGADVKVLGLNDNVEQPISVIEEGNGVYLFEWPVSKQFQAPQSIDFDVEVVDASYNFVSEKSSLFLSEESLQLEMFLAGELLKPGIENDVFVLATYPDGQPASVKLRITGVKDLDLATNEFGVGHFRYRPDAGISQSAEKSLRTNTFGPPGTVSFTVEAKIENAPPFKKIFSFDVDSGKSGYLSILPEKVYLSEFGALKVDVFSTKSNLPVYLDVFQNGQLRETFSTDLSGGKGIFDLTFSEDVFGTLELQAYQMMPDTLNSRVTMIRDRAIVVVNAAKSLNVETVLNQVRYAPGEEATLDLQVNREDGKAVNAALGLKIVDEALLALNEDDDRFSKYYLMLASELQDVSLPSNDAAIRAAFAKASSFTTNLGSEVFDHASDRNNLESKQAFSLDFLALLLFLLLIVFVFQVFFRASQEAFTLRIHRKIFIRLLPLLLISLFFIALFSLRFDFRDYVDNRNVLELFSTFLASLSSGWEQWIKFYIDVTHHWSYFAITFVFLWGLLWVYFKEEYFSDFRFLCRKIVFVLAVFLIFILGNRYDVGGPYISFIFTLLTLTLPVLLFFTGSVLAFVHAHEIRLDPVRMWLFLLVTILLSIFAPLGLVVVFMFFFVSWIVFGTLGNDDEIRILLSKLSKQFQKKKEKQFDYFKQTRLLRIEKKLRRKRTGRRLMIWGISGLVLCFGVIVVVNEFIPAGTHSGYEDFEPSFQRSPMNEVIVPMSNVLPDSMASGSQKGFVLDLPFYKNQQTSPQRSVDLGLAPLSESKTMKPLYVRSFFPEVMYFNPALIAEDGKASVSFPIADSITTWRLTALANSLSGEVGSGTDQIQVFQDFFLDFDPPSSLTVGDKVSVPVTVFNYLVEPQNVELTISEGSFFSLVSDAKQIVDVPAQSSALVYVTFIAEQFGEYDFRIDAVSAEKADAISKKITIFPNGKKIQSVVTSEMLSGDHYAQVVFPADIIPGTEKILMRIFPSYFSLIVEGLESVLRFPSGCFEQVSSSLYPDILVLDYLRRTEQSAPDIEQKAMEYIKEGFQKLLTYEVKTDKGGFSLYGYSPAETVLTAYGLMEFNDLSKVYDIDPGLIPRMKEFLYDKQQSTGVFEISGHGGLDNNSRTDLGRTAYIAWALSSLHDKDARLQLSLNYLTKNVVEISDDPYVLALIANALLDYDPKHASLSDILDSLADFAQREEELIYFPMKYRNYYGSFGQSGDVETTALVAMAFLKADVYRDLSERALNYLVAKRDPQGAWYSTQATALALKAFVTSLEFGPEKSAFGNITVTFTGSEGSEETAFDINASNAFVTQMLVFDNNISDVNEFEIVKKGDMKASYQLVKEYFVPYISDVENLSALQLSSRYDRDALRVNDVLTQTLLLKNNQQEELSNVLIRVPIPPGFSVIEESLEFLIESESILKRYQLQSDALYFYLHNVGWYQDYNFTFEMRAHYPVEASVMPVFAYDYYNPSLEAFSDPLFIKVR